MATPTAIRKQAEAVDKMHAQIYPVQTEARDPEKEQAEIDAKEKAAVSYTHLTLPTSDLV